MHSSRVHLMVTPEEVKVGLTRINGVSGLEILSTARVRVVPLLLQEWHAVQVECLI